MKTKIKKAPKVEFKVGDKVRVMWQSHGWGNVQKGYVGVVVAVYHDGLGVDFQNAKNWFGRFNCFELVKK